MRNTISLLLFFSVVLICHAQQTGESLAQTIITSFKEKNFKLLEPYLPTESVARKMSPKELGKKSSADINKLLSDAKTRLQEGWAMIAENVKKSKIDLSKLTLTEVIVYDPFGGKDMKGLIAGYDYKGHQYEDFQLIVAEVDGNIYLLEFPMTTRMLTLYEREPSELAKARQMSGKAGNDLPGRLQEKVADIIAALGQEDAVFGKLCVYRGDDNEKNWKSPVNPEIVADMEWPVHIKNQLTKYLAACMPYLFGTHFTESESEGTWLIQPVTCPDNTTISFAFLEVNGELLLGDIDVEQGED